MISSVTIPIMTRRKQAWWLLVALAMPSLLISIHATIGAAKLSCCAAKSCCSHASCPMPSNKTAMPVSCPMGSGPHHSQPTALCTCSVSQGQVPVATAEQSDFRFDLPRQFAPCSPSFALYAPPEASSMPLNGYTHPPDQPPRA